MTTLRIGGVPEHFNLPWRLLLEGGVVERLGFAVSWEDFPDGSGAMAAALREDRLDVALLLCEGAVAGVAGGGFKIVSLYTESPLIWGIHVPARSRLRAVTDIRGARYAISRRGSGSHLMSFVHAREQGWPTNLELVTVRNLRGAIDAFERDEADVFFWEKYMTKPLVDSGKFRRVGEFVAPWPAFVVCASGRALRERAVQVAAILREVLGAAARLAADRDAARLIAERYGLDAQDAKQWLGQTRWAARVGIEPAHVAPVVAALSSLELIDRAATVESMLAALPAT
jgi:ABC-type nitrate/sulfonate/bicarbonate transport system substrate-binding protein